MGCGCGGGQAGAKTAVAGTFTIQLANGTKVGTYPTRDHAAVALARTYNGNGTVVPK